MTTHRPGPPPAARSDLRPSRLLAVWAPLAATFLLVTGSAPVINASINRLPLRDHEQDLAAFGLFVALVLVLQSPLFVTREIAIKMSVSHEGLRQARRFCLTAAAVVVLAELLVALTPLGTGLLGLFSDRPEVIRGAQRAFLWAWPLPPLLVMKGVYQAQRIRADDTLFVALGTSARLAFTAALGLWLAPRLAISGPVLGAICFVAGMAIETVVVGLRTRRDRLPRRSVAEIPSAARFGLPLMLSNLLAVTASALYILVAGRVPADTQVASLAGFQEVRTLLWLPGSAAFALQPITVAKVRRPEDAAPMLRFGLLVGGAISLLLALVAFTPLREWVLVDLMNETPGGDVVRLAVPALMLGAALPLFNGFRLVLRGILISRALTRPIVVANAAALAVLTTLVALRWQPFEHNGVLSAYALWLGMIALEATILAWINFRLVDS